MPPVECARLPKAAVSAVPILAVLLATGVVMSPIPGTAQDLPPRRSFGTTPDMPPGGSGSFNPTGPSPSTPPGAIAPMPPGRGSFNPTGPLPGAPPGYLHPMPRGGSGSFSPTGPDPQPNVTAIPGLPRGGVLSPRRLPPTGSTSKAPVGPGLDNCIDGWTKARGLTRKEHDALCHKIWARARRGAPEARQRRQDPDS